MGRSAFLATSFVVTSALFVALAAPARAQDSAAADALFREAKELVAEGKIAEACPKFQAALELQKTLGTLMNLADCLEQDGKTGSAYQRWTEAVDMAKAQKDERATFAEERRAAVAPRVPKLLLDVVAGPEALRVSAGGVEVPASRFGLPTERDPGKLTVTVSRGETVLETREVTLTEGQTSTLQLDLAAIAKAHPPPPKAGARGPDPRPEQRIAGFVVLSVGLAGVTTFAILESIALARRSEANAAGNCVERNDKLLCSPQGYDLVEEAGTLAEAGQWVGLGGLALVGVGITLVLTAPAAEAEEAAAPEPSAALSPWALPGGGGLVFGGTW